MGFRSVIRENFPHLQVIDALEIGESEPAAFETTRRLMTDGTDLAAIYNIGAGSSGIARALEGIPVDRKPVFVAHDLSFDTRRHLLTGTIDAVLDQNAGLTADHSLARLHAAVNQQMLGVCEVMDSRIIFRDNIPNS